MKTAMSSASYSADKLDKSFMDALSDSTSPSDLIEIAGIVSKKGSKEEGQSRLQGLARKCCEVKNYNGIDAILKFTTLDVDVKTFVIACTYGATDIISRLLLDTKDRKKCFFEVDAKLLADAKLLVDANDAAKKGIDAYGMILTTLQSDTVNTVFTAVASLVSNEIFRDMCLKIKDYKEFFVIITPTFLDQIRNTKDEDTKALIYQYAITQSMKSGTRWIEDKKYLDCITCLGKEMKIPRSVVNECFSMLVKKSKYVGHFDDRFERLSEDGFILSPGDLAKCHRFIGINLLKKMMKDAKGVLFTKEEISLAILDAVKYDNESTPSLVAMFVCANANVEMYKWSALKALKISYSPRSLSHQLITLSVLLTAADNYFIKIRPRSEIDDFCKMLRGSYTSLVGFAVSELAEVLRVIAKHPRIKFVNGSNDIDHDATYK
jgi:hypothetical protein